MDEPRPGARQQDKVPTEHSQAVLRRIFVQVHAPGRLCLNTLPGVQYDERGQIYRGCTAFAAAAHTIQRLAALGGEVCSVHRP